MNATLVVGNNNHVGGATGDFLKDTKHLNTMEDILIGKFRQPVAAPDCFYMIVVHKLSH